MAGRALAADELLTIVVMSHSQVLFILGTLLIAMSLQLDRRGVWNMMGPCLFALVIMIAAWVSKGSQAGPAALSSPLENDGGRADTRLQPIHQAWLDLLETPRGRGSRARDSPSTSPVAEKSVGHRSQHSAAAAAPVERTPMAAVLSQNGQLLPVPWAEAIASVLGFGASAG